MVISNKFMKNIAHLQMRMNKIKQAYKTASFVGFWVSMIIFIGEVVYYGCRVVTMGVAYVNDLLGLWDVPDEKLKLASDITLFIMPLVCAVMSFISFRIKSRVMKYALLVVDIAFFAGCIYAFVVLPRDRILYGASMIYSVAVFVVCIRCIIADYDDVILSKIEGYPHFNPLLIHEDVPITTGVRFPDKKTNEELYEERMEEYCRENPDSPMAKCYREEKENERNCQINDWLGEMMVKKKK